MKSIEYTFIGNVPSKKNGRRWVQRGSKRYSVPSADYTSWEKGHTPILKHRFKSPKFEKFSIEIQIYYPDNRIRDTDNLTTSILDCLTAAEVIKDDRWQYQTAPPLVHQPIIDRDNPRVELKIWTD